MAEIKVVLSNPKTGKSYQHIIKDDDVKKFFNLKIGDSVKGELLGFSGYEFLITGGSDNAGFPMRKDVSGQMRKRIFSTGGIGIRNNEKGKKVRKNVAGNTIFDKTAQVNMKVTKAGTMPLGEDKVKEKKEEVKES